MASFPLHKSSSSADDSYISPGLLEGVASVVVFLVLRLRLVVVFPEDDLTAVFLAVADFFFCGGASSFFLSSSLDPSLATVAVACSLVVAGGSPPFAAAASGVVVVSSVVIDGAPSVGFSCTFNLGMMTRQMRN